MNWQKAPEGWIGSFLSIDERNKSGAGEVRRICLLLRFPSANLLFTLNSSPMGSSLSVHGKWIFGRTPKSAQIVPDFPRSAFVPVRWQFGRCISEMLCGYVFDG